MSVTCLEFGVQTQTFSVKKEDHARRSSIHKQGKTNIMSSCLLIFVRIIITVERRGLFICRHMLTPQSHYYKILSLRMISTQCNNKRYYGKQRDTNWPQYPENPISWKIQRSGVPIIYSSFSSIAHLNLPTL